MPTLRPLARAAFVALSALSVLVAPAHANSPVFIAPGDPAPPSFLPPVWPSAAATDTFTRDRAALHRATDAQAKAGTPRFQAPSAQSCRRPLRTHDGLPPGCPA